MDSDGDDRAEMAARPVVVRCVFCNTPNRVDLARLSAGPKCGSCGRPIRLDRPIKTADESFDQTIKGAGVPILVDCYADWCGPCRMMAPALDDFAQRHAGEVLVLKLDTDANPQLSTRLGIRGIPTLIAFEHGKERARHIGIADVPALEKLVGLA
jgi:thioredoxin 2